MFAGKKVRHKWTNTVRLWSVPSHVHRQQDRASGGLGRGEGAAAAYWAESGLLRGERRPSDWLSNSVNVCLYNQWPLFATQRPDTIPSKSPQISTIWPLTQKFADDKNGPKYFRPKLL